MILRRIKHEPSDAFTYNDKGNMAIIGRGSAIADIRGIRFSGPIAWLAWLFLHIFELIGFRNRIVVMVEWAAAYITLQRSVRLITYQDLDSQIRSGLDRMIDNDPALNERDVNFDVANGMVTIKGEVRTVDEKNRVGEMTKAAPGVKDVANGLQINPEP